MSEFSRETTPVARKEYVCDHCGKLIEAGEKYSYSAGKQDGYFGVFRSHIDCASAGKAFWHVHDFDWDQGVCLQNDAEPDDEPWLRERFPAVAERLFGAKEPASTGDRR